MRCAICKRTSDETRLFSGISKAEMVNICEDCARSEGVPIVKKPTEIQLTKADERYTVRERMERMSGVRDATEISEEQTITQGNLAKLRVPPKKQHHDGLTDNYYWTLNLARRRAKMSITQLAEKMQVESKTIQGVEKGKLPDNFEELFIKLEAFLGIKLLKNHKTKVNFTRENRDEEREILESVQARMNSTDDDSDNFQEKLEDEEIKLSKREDLSSITIDDLVDRKRRRDKKKAKSKEDTFLGEDLDIEEL